MKDNQHPEGDSNVKKAIPAAIALATFLAVFAWSGCGKSMSASYPTYPTTPPGNPPPTSTSNTVTMANMAFVPSTITVDAGATVTWKNNDSYVHTATSDAATWNTGDIAAGASHSYTFTTPGTYTYHCAYHASMGMRGTVIVQSSTYTGTY